MNILSRSIAVILLLLALGLAIRSWDSEPSEVVSAVSVSSPPSPRKARPAHLESLEVSGGDSGPDANKGSVARTDAADPQDSDPDADAQEDPTHAGDQTPALAKALEFRRNLRKEIELMDETSDQFTVLQPAAWVDLGDDPALSTSHSQGIQQIAEELKQQIADSGLDPASPEYRRLWNRAVRESDWKFRARYGARAWTRHHIQAHHMAAANQNK